MQRLAGIIQFQIDGTTYPAKGSFSYNPGIPKRDPIVGSDGVHGFKETPQVPFIEGEVTDMGHMRIADLIGVHDALATLSLANGKTFILHGAYYAGDGTVSTEEANIGLRLEGSAGEEITA